MTIAQSNAFYLGANTIEHDETAEAEGIRQLLHLGIGCVVADTPDELKEAIRTIGNDDLRVIFKVTVETVEVVGVQKQ